jgi:hypothetical protein
MLKLMVSLALLICLNLFGDVYNGPTSLTLKFYDDLSINGPATLKLVKAKSLEVKGALDFKSVDVAGKAEVQGPMKGSKGKFGQLHVTGPVDVDHVLCEELTVQGPMKAMYIDITKLATIEGPLDVQHGKFKSLAVTADKIILDEVVVDTITVSKGSKDQVLILKSSTVVNGDIVFESGEGTVQVESPKVVIKGSVKGATVK